MKQNKEKTISEIKNFALNICNWQTINTIFFQKMSIHIQDIVENFTITSIIIDNGCLKFEGIYNNEGTKRVIISENEIKPEELEKVLEVLKDINLFVC